MGVTEYSDDGAEPIATTTRTANAKERNLDLEQSEMLSKSCDSSGSESNPDPDPYPNPDHVCYNEKHFLNRPYQPRLPHRWQRKCIKVPNADPENGLGLRGRDQGDCEEIPLDSLSLGAPTAVTDAEAHLLTGYVERARKDSERFYQAADQNRRKQNWTSVILLVILTITAGGSTLYNIIVPTDPNETQQAYAYRITVNVLLCISAVIQAMQQVFRYEQKSSNYEMTGDDFYNYAREWQMRIVQGVDDRRDKCLEALASARHSLREIELGALPLR